MGRLLSALFEFVIVVIVGRLLGRALRLRWGSPQVRFKSPFENSGAAPGAESYGGKTARDPVCGMFVSTELSHRLEENGETLHFCSPECRERYQKDHVHAQT